MTRSLRHVTVSDAHDRISGMKPQGVEQIANAGTEQLKDVIRTLVKGITLSDQQWTVFYYIQDELLERGEWDEELARIKSGKP